MLGFAVGNLLSRPLRSLLALVGLAIAICGMVALFAIAEGIDHVVERTFAQIPGLSITQLGAPVPVFSTLPASWKDELQRLPDVNVVDSEVIQRLNLLDGKPMISPPRMIVGVDLHVRPGLEYDIYRAHMIEGQPLGIADAGTNHCIISRQIARDVGKRVGETLLLNQFPARISGIYETGSILLDVNVVMDLDVVRQFMRMSPDTVNCFYVEPRQGADKQKLKREIEDLFRNRQIAAAPFNFSQLSSGGDPGRWIASLLHNVPSMPSPPSETSSERPLEKEHGEPPRESPGAVEVRLAEDWTDRFSEFTGDLDLFLTLITGIGVAIAVLSIVNTMVMSVTERMIEFGILRANGWSQGNVLQLMLLESSLLGFVGGVSGVSLGWVATFVVNRIWPERLQLYASLSLLGFGILFSTLLGVIGGLYPAWIAARKSPMEAIRRG